ncbi:hypothetical protein CPB85DRAFT_1318679 [Mucidula mucida]|nr:hypothetical protein CPB85DRAFT_1318679 [Mucidula mucida]
MCFFAPIILHSGSVSALAATFFTNPWRPLHGSLAVWGISRLTGQASRQIRLLYPFRPTELLRVGYRPAFVGSCLLASPDGQDDPHCGLRIYVL